MSFFSLTTTVIKSFFRKPYTTKYPFAPAVFPKGSRGHIAIDIDKCIYCSICARRCPTFALKVDKNERSWSIERLKCITCNLCVDVCPKKCLSMEQGHSAAVVKGSIEKHVGKPVPAPAQTPAPTASV